MIINDLSEKHQKNIALLSKSQLLCNKQKMKYVFFIQEENDKGKNIFASTNIDNATDLLICFGKIIELKNTNELKKQCGF